MIILIPLPRALRPVATAWALIVLGLPVLAIAAVGAFLHPYIAGAVVGPVVIGLMVRTILGQPEFKRAREKKA